MVTLRSSRAYALAALLTSPMLAATAAQEAVESVSIPIEVGPGQHPQVYVEVSLEGPTGESLQARMLLRRDDDPVRERRQVAHRHGGHGRERDHRPHLVRGRDGSLAAATP